MKFSAEWTPEERLKLTIILTGMIRDDVNAGRYSALGRPNVQSVHEMILATPSVLEEHRESIESLVDEFFKGREDDRKAFFSEPLSTYWEA